MDSRRKRGLEYQRWVKKWLEENYSSGIGCVVHNQPMNHICIGKGKWISSDNDILGCIDLICIIPNAKPLFIQATLDRGVTRKLDKLRKVPWNLDHCSVQVWIKRSPTRTSIKELREVTVDGDVELVDIGEIERRKYVPSS